MRRSLASRLRFLVISLCLGFGLSVLVAFNYLTSRQVEATAQRDVTAAAGFLRIFIDGRTGLLSSLTRVEAVNPRVRALAESDNRTVAEETTFLRDEAKVDAVTITDPSQRVFGEGGFASPLTSIDQLPGIASAADGRSWAGLLVRDEAIWIAATEPIREGPNVVSTITMYVRLGDEVARHLKSQARLELAFVSGGRVTGGSIQIPALPIPHKDGKPWTASLNGKDYAARYEPLPGTSPKDQLGFVVMRPLDEIAQPYRTFSLAFLSVLALVAALALLGGSAFTRSIVRSLEGIVNAAQQLRSGHWPEKFGEVRTDEIGLLQETFNGMTDALRSSQERLIAMIDVEPLTELANHRFFKERLAEEAARTTASEQTLALLLLDIDHFTAYNNAHGHGAGDRMLQDVADVLRSVRPEFATLARYGGEEFAILLPGGTVADAKELFALIRGGLKDITLSGGCAELSSAKGRSEGLLVAAELAVHRAKQLGRNQICDFAAVPGADEDEPMMLYRNLQDGTYATVKALAAAVDAKDPYTHGHSDRVARLAADLAGYVGAEAAEIDRIHRCGTLHDVGKIGVPDAILQKPGPLDAEEIRVMQSHPVLGEFIVGKVPQLVELLPGVRHHHERYDGKGYPDGLAGTQIPRIARFLAIADTYDAMTSDRPYRKGLDPQVALAEIERGAGAQFDPDLAPKFAAMMRQAASGNAGKQPAASSPR